MTGYQLTETQIDVIHHPPQGSLFISGPAMAGKTTAAVERLLHLVESGVPCEKILVFVPQRTLALPYWNAVRDANFPPGSVCDILTIGGLARRSIDIFWPLVSNEAGFSRPDLPPIFLTMETAQYYMASIALPRMEQDGFFDSITIRRGRIYSQILDNLNKSAVVGFPHTEFGERLQEAWIGDPGQSRVYRDAQVCAADFRCFCLENNLLDFSLQVEIFRDHLWRHPVFQAYFQDHYHHLIADNVEEDVPISHDLIRDCLPELRSALIIADRDAGYRRFLGADPVSAYKLAAECDHHVQFDTSIPPSDGIQELESLLIQSLRNETLISTGINPGSETSVKFQTLKYFPEMLDWVVESVSGLIHHNSIPAGEIVVLAPFLNDALRFSLLERFKQFQIPARTHRPSRALRDEPTTHCLLTLAALAHPGWGMVPSDFEVASAFFQALGEDDALRTRLLSRASLRIIDDLPRLVDFDSFPPETRDRVSYQLGMKYQKLKTWLDEYSHGVPQPLDHFFSRLFGEVLSQPGFGFHGRFDRGEIAANLIESFQKFRRSVRGILPPADGSPAKEYIQMVREGVMAAQYLKRWEKPFDEAVFVAPAYTFLMNNYPVDYQFWLDVGSYSWYERIFQPLTHPYVLSRSWERGQLWTDLNERTVTDNRLQNLVSGLLRRCRKGVYLGITELNQQGYDQKGALLQALNRVLRHTHQSSHRPNQT